ncbi:MAG: alpha/beta hydrolase [Sphingomonadaceae bacterium]|nr:alpha/beta hydrolase [Sphingomonadaceae bacterium]
MTAEFPAFDPRARPAGLRFSEWNAPDGWAHRTYSWAQDKGVARQRGSLLYQGGRADFAEKHLESLYDWHRAGWHLSGFDWRGQGGSGRLLADPHIGHLPSLDPLVDDLAAFVVRWQAETPPPHVIVAHSMGAHIALRMLAERDCPIDAGVLLAPMLGINTAPFPEWFARVVVAGMRLAGRGARAAWREGQGGASDRMRQLRLTSSIERFEHGRWWKRRHPELTTGGPSWDWIAAALGSQCALDQDGALEAISTPLLILATPTDRLVSSAGIARAAERLRDARLRMFPGAAHDLLREADPIRSAVMAEIAAFLDERAPAR